MILAVCMSVSQFCTLLGAVDRAFAEETVDPVPQYSEPLIDYSSGAGSFSAPWTNAAYNTSERVISGNTAASGGNRNSISELYFPGTEAVDTEYYADYTIEIPESAVSFEGWGGSGNHSLDIIIGAAGEYAYKLRMRLDGSADFLLGYSNDSVTRANLGKALSNHRMMGLNTGEGCFNQAPGLKDLIRTEDGMFRIRFVVKLDIAGQTVSVWANDQKVFSDVSVKGSLGAADYGTVTPAFGVCVESASAENILNPLIRVGHIWGTEKEIEEPEYSDDKYDYSDESYLKTAWVKTARYDRAAKTVEHFYPDSTNPQSYSELYVNHLSELKTVFANMTVRLPKAEVSFDNSHDQSFQVIVGKATDGYLYKIDLRLYCRDVLFGFATAGGSVPSMCELSGAYFGGISTRPLYQFVGLDSLARSDDEYYTYDLTYALNTDSQTINVWINGKRAAANISLTEGYSHGSVYPVLGLYAVNSNIIAHSRTRINHIWSEDAEHEQTGAITPSSPAFFSDGRSEYASETLVLNKDGVRGKLQSDAVIFEGLEFLDSDYYEISADIAVLDHFNQSPVNSNSPGLISIVFADRDNTSTVLEAAIRPSVSGQFGIIQTMPVRNRTMLFSGFTNSKEHGQPVILVSSNLIYSEKFRLTENEGDFFYPPETTFKVIYDHGKLTVAEGGTLLMFREEINPDTDGGEFAPAVGFAAYNYKVRISNIRVSGAKQHESEQTQDDSESGTLLKDASFDEDRIVASIGVLSDSHCSYSYFGEREISTAAGNFIDAIYNVNAASTGGLDAIMMTGDYTSTGTINQAASFMNVLGEGIRLLDNDSLKLSLAYGNHDTDWGNSLQPEEWDRMLKNGLVSMGNDGWRIAESGETADIPGLQGYRVSDSSYNSDAPAGCYDTVIEKTVYGRTYRYHLINIETDTYYFNSVTNIFTRDVLDWLDRTLKAITDDVPGQYVFVGMHAPIKESGIYATEMWADTNADWGTSKASARGLSGNIDDILRKYPQAVVFSGHTHYMDYLETTIMQKNYTAVNVPPAAMAGSLNASKNHLEGSNDGSTKGMALLVELDADGNQRITRIDLNKTSNLTDVDLTLKKVKNQSTASGEKSYPEIYAVESIKAAVPSSDSGYHGEVSRRWTLPAPRSDRAHLCYYSKARGASNTVKFPEGSVLKCETAGLSSSGSMINMEFPAAVSSDPDVSVLHYRIQVFDKKTGEELLISHANVTNTTLKEVWTYGNWNPVKMGAANGTNHLDATSYAYDNLRIDTIDDVIVSIIPVDEYGHEGAALKTDFSPFIEVPSTDGENLAPKSVLVDMNRRTVSKWTSCSYTLNSSNTERIQLKGLKPGNDYVFAANALIRDNKALNTDGNEINWEGLIFQVAAVEDGNGNKVIVEARVRTSALVIMYLMPDGSEVYLTQTPINNPFDQTAEYIVHYHGGKVDFFRNGEGIMCNFNPQSFGLKNVTPYLGFGGEVTSYTLNDVRIISEDYKPDPAVPEKPDGNGNYISYVTGTVSSDVLSYDGKSVSSLTDVTAQSFDMATLPFKAGESYVFDFDLTAETAEKTWMGGRLFFGADSDGNRYGVLFTHDAVMISHGDDIIYQTPFPRILGKTYHADVFADGKEVSVWVDGVLFVDSVVCEDLTNTVSTILFEYCKGKFANLNLYYTDPVKYVAPHIPVLKRLGEEQYNAAEWMKVTYGNEPLLSYYGNKLSSDNTKDGVYYYFENLPLDDEMSYYYSGRFTAFESSDTWKLPRFIFRTSDNKPVYLAFTRENALIMCGNDVIHSVPVTVGIGNTYDVVILSEPDRASVWLDGKLIMSDIDLGSLGRLKARLGLWFEMCRAQVTDLAIYGDDVKLDPTLVDMDLYNDEFYRMKGIPEIGDRLNLFQNITMTDYSNGALGSEFDSITRTLRTEYPQGSGNITFTDALGSENINGLKNGSGYVFRFKYKVDDWKAEVTGDSGISVIVNNSRHTSYTGTDMYYNSISISGDSLVMQSFQRGRNIAYSIVPFGRENGRTYDVAIVHGPKWIKLFVDGEIQIVMTDLPVYNISFEAYVTNAATVMSDIQVYEFVDSGLSILDPIEREERSQAGNTIYDAVEREQQAAASELTGKILMVAGPAAALCALTVGGAAFVSNRRRRKAS